ncbi:T9SS type A sorting domain-containing protein [Psychroflexus sediminis]|uniref:Por secretion system C-terminal sorting domain-containing protein n=1 Tax=Psychroflexus sediminis TaxID=470826 RepID=A0A1G7TWB2_9FLAO|nr:T9SS type A sorting domain-containing protein [Psychroflexus sediminis]SDG39605.1 Por secretion system C-terminal sorting domain-containing protein [Psychroflexus sediminis]
MKSKLLFLLCLLFSMTASSQLFQKNIEFAQGHFANANLAQVNDGTNDVIIASNLLSAAAPIPILKRLQDDGTVVWSKTYDDTTLANARFFDIVNYFDLIFVVGSIDVSGVKKVFAAQIEAQTGDILDDKYYEILNASFNSTGFNVIISNTDATGDTNPNLGLLITGFFGNCPNADPSCSLNLGFALRTDLSLNELWTTEVGSSVSGNLNYDFVNGAVETSDGFVLTGSATGELNGNIQAGVLIHKIDFEGNFVWDNSYIFGNSRDVSVDGYYDSTSDEVFLLTNFSAWHHFGVTVVDNANGTINAAKSWYVNEVSNNLDFYGFSLVESLSSPNNLIIYGYRRDYFDGTDNNQSNIIIYEFDKATGNEVGTSYQYLAPFQETQPEPYNLWTSQLPLIYYPDMAIIDSDATTPIHFAVGYRNGDAANGGLANIELVNVDAQKMNACSNIIIDYTRNALGTVDFITNVSSALVTTTDNTMALNDTAITLNIESCSTQLSVIDQNKSDIKLYPNPASDYVFISDVNVKNIRILDITGKQVIETTSYQKNKGLYIGNLKSGIYFISVKTERESVENLKLVKK